MKCECRVTKIAAGIKRDMRGTEREKPSWSTAPERRQASLLVAVEMRAAELHLKLHSRNRCSQFSDRVQLCSVRQVLTATTRSSSS